MRAFLGHYPETSDARGAGAATSLGRGLPLAEAGAPGELPAATATLWTGLARAQLEIGDDHRDLDEFVDGEVQSGHLTVDPHQPVVLARSHAAHPRAGAPGYCGGSR